MPGEPPATVVTDSIVVTGALGGSGSWIVESLREDHDVVAVDLTLPEHTDVDGVNFQALDFDRPGAIWETVLDADPSAVVHFGNIPTRRTTPAGTSTRTTR